MMRTVPENILEPVRKQLLSSGIYDEAVDDQLAELEELILMNGFVHLMKLKPPPMPFTSIAETSEYIEKNFSEAEIQGAIKREGDELVRGYLKIIELGR